MHLERIDRDAGTTFSSDNNVSIDYRSRHSQVRKPLYPVDCLQDTHSQNVRP